MHARIIWLCFGIRKEEGMQQAVYQIRDGYLLGAQPGYLHDQF
jgi:hypothetical protein